MRIAWKEVRGIYAKRAKKLKLHRFHRDPLWTIEFRVHLIVHGSGFASGNKKAFDVRKA